MKTKNRKLTHTDGDHLYMMILKVPLQRIDLANR
jgi:hypothetical protein